MTILDSRKAFRIESAVGEEFEKLCKRNKTTRSEALRNLVHSCVEAGSLQPRFNSEMGTITNPFLEMQERIRTAREESHFAVIYEKPGTLTKDLYLYSEDDCLKATLFDLTIVISGAELLELAKLATLAQNE